MAVLCFTACGGGKPIYYAKIVNTDTALMATKIRYTSVKAMMVQPTDTVQVIDYGKAYTKVRLGLNDGFVPTENLEIIKDQEVVERIHKEREAITVPFSLWMERNVFNILAILAVLTIAAIIFRTANPSFVFLMVQLALYVLMIGVGLYLMNSNYDVYDDQLDVGFGTSDFWGHVWNVLKITLYFIAVIWGYMNTGNALLFAAGNSDFSKRKKGISIYLWIILILLIAGSLASKFNSNIPYYVVLAWFLWNMYNNCRAVWPKVHYPIIVALLGLFASAAMLYTFIHIFKHLLLLFFFGAGLFTLVKNPSILFSDTEKGQPPYVPPVNDPYDKVIKGGGSLGEDIKARENFDGSLTDESGGHWDYDDNGNYKKRI
jgi:hypothetical protein